ncbi:MAG: hypothetical protein IPH58_19525 [Sphingobacteriales bacterium]|nr:hypothetical protein [Sphingobacteriales bacterium]
MKKLLFILLSFYSIIVCAQQYNNEWIDYNKTYYKFKVGTTGLYRIIQSQLAAINLTNTNVSQFQLWRNGKEIPIYVSNQSGTLPAGGYIEFWGEMNDGKADLDLYRKPEFQISDVKSLFTDTASYFLTVNPSPINKRLVPTSNSIPGGAIPEPYFLHKTGEYFTEQIHFGTPFGSGSDAVYAASYEDGEGWASNDIANSGTRNFSLNNLFVYTGAGAPDIMVKMNAVGNAFNARKIQLTLNGEMIFDNQMNSYAYQKLSKTLNVSKIAGSTANFIITNTSTSANDRMRVAFVEMSYPRVFNFGGAKNFRFQLPARATGTYLEISGFSFSGIPVLYDLNNGKRYEADASNPSLIKVFLQPTSTAQDLILVSQEGSNIKGVTGFEVRNFVDYSESSRQGDYLMIAHNSLLNGSSSSHPVEEYRTYRTTQAGGSFNAKIYMIDQLIDQFSFGIKQDPLAIRNFIRLARNRFSSQIRNVFLIGKGVNYYSARLAESSPETEKINLIPTFGSPGSDVLLSAEGSSSVPLSPIGRISIVKGDELSIYLEKVKQYELQKSIISPLVSESSWKKDVVHMVGSNSQSEINLLYQLLNNHKAILKDTFYGANVSDFLKDLSSTGQQLNSDRLAALINNGVGLLTYFGHSSATSLGFNLELPENYSNQSKYPIFNMMGCDVGNIFGLQPASLTVPQTLSEKYLLAKERGCIAMLAGTSLGYINSLDVYNLRFYTDVGKVFYGEDLGSQMVNTIKRVFQAIPESDLLQRTQCEEYVLHGDPAIKFYSFDKPDYAIEDRLIKVSPNFISVAESEFTVDCKIYNLGRAVKGNLIVEMKRTFPDLTNEIIRRDTLPAIYYSDSLQYTIPINPVKDKGMNKITISVDPENQFDELFETNNSITKEVFIFEDDLKPLFPFDKSIVSKQGITFSTSTANPFAPSKTYLMEMDTTELFNSTLKISLSKVSTGGVIEFNPSVVFRDSTVYYWRVATMPATQSEQPMWNSASFIYINGDIKGFNQSHYFQYNDNLFKGLLLDSKRDFVFGDNKASINITTGIYPYAGQASNYQLQVNDLPVARSWVAPFENQMNSLRFYVLDNRSMKILKNVDLGTTGRFGSQRPIKYFGGAVTDFFQFDLTTPTARKTIMNFIDSIPDNNYVIVTNSIYNSTVLPSVWRSDTTVFGSGNSLYHKLMQLGASKIDNVTSFVPFIFILQKGNPNALIQRISDDAAQILDATVVVNASGFSGTMETDPIGVAKAWNKIFWNGISAGTIPGTLPSLDIIGLKKDGSELTILKGTPLSAQPIDISSIDAKIYPQLKIRLNTKDSVNYKPFQLKRLMVDYLPAPEGALAPNFFFSKKDSLEAGEPFNLGVAFKNVSDYAFDSLSVKFTIRDKNNIENIITVPNQNLYNLKTLSG